jgi:hypothetical protein
LSAAAPLLGVYAPVPEQDPDQDKKLTVTVKGGLAHDSNLFGAATSEVSTAVWTLAPRVSYARSWAQTYVLAGYGLTLDQFDQRPGDKLLDSHDANLRVAHQFSKVTSIDVNESLSVSRNPESLLAGVKLNTDQSFNRNQLDGRVETKVVEKVSATVKARSVYYEYRDGALGRSLDRIENLYGVAGEYAVAKETLTAVAEYRHQDVFYAKVGETKNKRSDYLMGGADFKWAKTLSVSGRLGAEWRSRSAERSTTSPYAEFSAKWDYDAPKKSFLLGGLGYSLEETSDTLRFNDTKAFRGFVTVQHAVSKLIWASASFTFEPSTLQGRRGQVDVDEHSTRAGVALTYLRNKNWSFSASFDYDRVGSDDPGRTMKRGRGGVSAVYSF